jgi:O-antigen/teichoic acid export membrane protein
VEARSSRRLLPLLWRAQLALVACAGAFALLVSLEAAPLLALVAPKYVAAERLLPLVSLTPVLLGSALVFGNVLRAAERPDLSARAFVLASVAASGMALFWCEREGAWGAALALSSGYATLLAGKATLAFRAVRSRRSSA